jgi:hypothetical protein
MRKHTHTEEELEQLNLVMLVNTIATVIGATTGLLLVLLAVL